MSLKLRLIDVTSNLDLIKRWWVCACKRKEIYDAICSAVLNDMSLTELEPLGLDEKTKDMLEHGGIHSVEDLVNANFDRIIEIKYIGTVSLWKILRAITLLPKLDELSAGYFDSIAPNFHYVTNKRFEFVAK